MKAKFWMRLILVYTGLSANVFAGTITGLVRDSETYEPVAGATVAVAGATVAVGDKVALTDDNGEYSFSDLPAGTYVVTANFAGAQAQSGVIVLEADATVEVPLAIQMQSPVEEP